MTLRLLGLLLVVLLLSTREGVAQEDTDQDTVAVPRWTSELTGTLSASQAAYRNWQEGGVNTLAFTSRLDGKAVGRGRTWRHEHEIRLAFGQVKHDSLEFRKATDQARYTYSILYEHDGPFDPTGSFEIRSQFAPGFNYEKNPYEVPRDLPVKVSDAFSPATITQSIGLAYEPAGGIRTRLGVGAKQTVVLIERMRPLYGLRPDQQVRMQVGIESRTEFDRDIFENASLRSRLSLFAAFNQPEVPDALWENVLRMKINSWLNVDLEVTSYYDADVTRRVQLKQVLSLGISVQLL